jgi:hypothetical protein
MSGVLSRKSWSNNRHHILLVRLVHVTRNVKTYYFPIIVNLSFERDKVLRIIVIISIELEEGIKQLVR